MEKPIGAGSTRHAHSMPFGPLLPAEGGVLFRLWAPSAGKVELCLENERGAQEFTPMRRLSDGWFEIHEPAAGPGSLYRFRIDGELLAPDPASRAQWRDVHGPSMVVDPNDFTWGEDWCGRPWEEAVIYEVHTGAFTPEGTFAGVSRKLQYLAELGVTAIELMPVSDFPGERNWGYDGVLPFAPDRAYGSPVDLKTLIRSAHNLGLMVILDVVYNHFGPEGNYLHVYAREDFFSDRHRTPWGDSINFCGENSRTVRDFFIHNALYWLEEYQLDGLRLDAVNAVFDDTTPHILEEIAQAVREGPGKSRHIHLVLENDDNAPRYLSRNEAGVPAQFTAQWNDDLHHACHVLLSSELDGYYADYADAPIRHLGRCLTEGFAYQGEISPYRGGRPRGGKSGHLPPQAFVSFLQNHDQIGNRAFGERLSTLVPEGQLRLAVAAVLLAPGTPLLFMGEEFGASTPFLFFCDFGPELKGKIAAGRLQEFAKFPKFSDPAIRDSIPDPEKIGTFLRSRLDWDEAAGEKGARFLELYGTLLDLRRREISPRLARIRRNQAASRILSPQALLAHWTLGDGSRLRLLVNLGADPVPLDAPPPGRMIFEDPPGSGTMDVPALPPQSVAWFLEEWPEDPGAPTDGAGEAVGKVDAALHRICDLQGIVASCLDEAGNTVPPTPEARRRLAETLGLRSCAENDPDGLLGEIAQLLHSLELNPCMVMPETGTKLHGTTWLPQWVLTRPLQWSIGRDGAPLRAGLLDLACAAMQEGRETGAGRSVAVSLTLPVSLPRGYHVLSLLAQDADRRFETACTIISTPARCYVPPGLQESGRVWGFSADVGTLRSDRSRGVGDFSDLRVLLRWAAQQGAGTVAVAPLQAVSMAAPEARARFDSLTFLSTLHLDPEEMADFHESPEAAAHCLDPSVRVRLASLREAEEIDFSEVARVKTAIFEICWRHFRENHLDPDSERGHAFRTFQEAGGERLRAWAVFETLREHFADSGAGGAWREWPEEFRQARSAAESPWARERSDRLEYHQYLQWQAELQLGGIGRRSMELGLKVGLWQTLPERIDAAGFEAWYQPHLFATTSEAGTFSMNAPLLAANLSGSLPEPLVSSLRANMRFAGAIALPVSLLNDTHLCPLEDGTVLCLQRSATELKGIIALESVLNRCLVVFQHDRELTEKELAGLSAISALTFRPGHFEAAGNGDWLPPGSYPAHAAVAASDTGLTSLNGFWLGRDIALEAEAPLAGLLDDRERRLIERAADRARLLIALRRHGLLPRDLDVDPSTVPCLGPEMVRATHLFLAQTASRIFLLPLQDLPGLQERETADAGSPPLPAWRRRLGANLEDMQEDRDLEDLLRAFCAERGVGVVRPSPSLSDRRRRTAASMPRAFYRLQLHSGFTFRDAAALVPYLAELGISHCYLSPCLKARPGSPHGYDIVDHGALNPELGSREEFEGFASALDEHRMAQILDVVPNHMAVGSDNVWWMDVLENGQSSRYAGYFDINWRSRQPELEGRVLLPVLGDHYGAVLESGRLRLVFLRDEGAFAVRYYDHRFPVDPRTCPHILGRDLERLGRELGSRHQAFLEFQNLLSSFANLPDRQETEPESRRTRQRNKEVLKRLLARLCREAPKIADFIGENVLWLNGEAGRSESFDPLHELLEAQPYRLAFWRVAADEINYRRFFDINDLAGIRMEDPQVFEETHRLVLDLVATGKVDGLRIDHPDGLYDPKGYFRRLQEALGHEAQDGLPPLYVVAEKILADFEHLPPDWPVHGTTGYDFGAAVGGLFVDPAAEREMTRCYRRFIGAAQDFDELLHRTRRLIITTSMTGELNVLAGELTRLAKSSRHTRDFTLNGLRDALIEFVAEFPVYRTYIGETGPTRHERNCVEWAVARARSGQGSHAASMLDFLRSVMLLETDANPDLRDLARDFVMKAQQYTGPVMAKGMEDTAFFIANRLLSLNEVGADPRRFGVSPSSFHRANRERAAHHPQAMLNTSTHDSKRSGDVRCRISVLSEMPDEWEAALRRWRTWNQSWRRKAGGSLAPSRNDEYALYQNLIGAWPLAPLDDGPLALFTERMAGCMLKSAREAKVRTSWVNPDHAYEDALLGFVRGILADRERFLPDLSAFQEKTARFGMLNSLSQLLFKLTSPGIPDIYQGSELWRLSLVDPDNRRPVDFGTRRAALDALRGFVDAPPGELAARARDLLGGMADGRAKLYTLWRTLGLRREHAGLFEKGSYHPLAAEGDKQAHVVAFLRQAGTTRVLVAAPRLAATLLDRDAGRLPLGDEVWGDTSLPLPEGLPRAPWVNIFTGEQLHPQDRERLQAAECFRDYPLCLLLQTSDNGGHHERTSQG